MTEKSSEQASRELVDSINREFASGGTGDKTRELAREIGGDSVRESEQRQQRRRRSGYTVRSPSTSTPDKVEQLPAEQVMSKAPPELRQPPQPTISTVQQKQASVREQLSSQAISDRAQRQRQLSEEAEKRGDIPEALVRRGTSMFLSGASFGRQIIDTSVDRVSTPFRSTKSYLESGFKSSTETAAAITAAGGIRAVVESQGSQLGQSLRETPIGTGAEIITMVAGVPATIAAGRLASRVTAGLRTDYVRPATVTSGSRFTVTQAGVVRQPPTKETVLYNVPDGGTGTTITVRGGTASTAEDLAVQVARGGTTTDAVSGQVGLIPRTTSFISDFTGTQRPLNLRPVGVLDDAFFTTPDSRLRTSRLGLSTADPDPTGQTVYTLTGTRPQVLLTPGARVANYPSDIQRFIRNDPRTWTQAQRQRLEQWQIEAGRDRFTAPGFISTESELITTAPVLGVQRTATTVLDGRRVPIFRAVIPDVSDTKKLTTTSFSQTTSMTSPNIRYVDLRPVSGRLTQTATAPGFSSRSPRVESPSSPISSSASAPSTSSASLDSEPSGFVGGSTPSPSLATSPTVSSPRISRPSIPPRSPPSTPSTPSPPVSPPIRPPVTRSPPVPPRTPLPPLTPKTPSRSPRPQSMFQRARTRFTAFFKPRQDEPFRASSITGTSLRDVTSRAVAKVGGTAKASFKIKDDKGKKISPEELLKFTPKGMFTTGKTIKGAVVEKAKFRISTPGEVREISMKGQRARKKIL